MVDLIKWFKKKLGEVKKKVALKWLAQTEGYIVTNETFPGYVLIDFLHDNREVGDIWDFSKYDELGIIGWTQIDDWSNYRGMLRPVTYKGVVYAKEGGGFYFDWDVAELVLGDADEDFEE